eukprot:263598_1
MCWSCFLEKLTIHVALIGDPNVGKRSFIVRRAKDKFDKNNKIYNQHYSDTSPINICKSPIFSIYNQRLFNYNDPKFKCKCIVFMFDLTNKCSLSSIKNYYKDSRKVINDDQFVGSVLVGTKYDLFEKKSIEYKLKIATMARKYATKMNNAPLVFCSSLHQIHIRKIFQMIVYEATNR